MKLRSFLAMLLIVVFLAGCSAPVAQDPSAAPSTAPSAAPAPSPGAAAGKYTPGTYSATAKGFGGDVTVTITVDDNNITAVEIEGKNETPGIGQNAIELLPGVIKAAGSAEVDGVSGATASSNGIKTAAAMALTQAMGGSSALSLADGTYTAASYGFSVMEKIPVTVTVAGGKITAIELGENKETIGEVKAAVDLLIPRIIEYQSLSVDAVCGATSTSNGIKNAVLECCLKAGASQAALYAPITVALSADETVETDILIVGMGGAGTTAALAAVETGKSVLAIDKAGKWGGTAAVTGGSMGVNVPSQVAAKIDEWPDPTTGKTRVKKAGERLVNADVLNKAWLEYTTVDGVQDAKPDIIRKTIDQSGEVLDWMTGYGFQFNNAEGFIGGPYGIYCTYVGNKSLTESFFASMYKKYEEMGGKYMLETEATELIMESGKVTGAKAVKLGGGNVTIKAKQVILATGGFAGNAEMKSQYIGGDWRVYGMTQNDGAGIRMALAAGAATYNIEMPPMAHFAGPSTIMLSYDDHADNDIPYGLACSSESLMVNPNGERFMDESNIAFDGYKVGPRYYAVYSREQIDVLRNQGPKFNSAGRYLTQGGIVADTPLKNIDTVLEEAIKLGYVYKASSLDALADAIGGSMNKDTLKASVKAYAEAAKGGEDPFKKQTDRYERLGSVSENSEYYIAVTGAPYIYSTCGGLDVNASMQVLDKSGNVIEGLYAVGTDSMGVLFTGKKGYINFGGVAQGYVFVSGRIAALDAAKK